MSHIIRMYDLAGVKEGGVVRCHYWIILPGWSPSLFLKAGESGVVLDDIATP